MRTLFENMLRSLVRFKAATLLNIIGMSVAFASFMIIMAQVRYDLTFDTGYANSGKLYRVDMWNTNGSQEYDGMLSPFLIQEISQSSPDIRQLAFADGQAGEASFFDPQQGNDNLFVEPMVMASASLPELFGLQWVEGDPKAFKTPNAALLSQSTARRMFGNESPVGHQLSWKGVTKDTLSTIQVVGVYEDLPTNSTIPNGVIINIEKDVTVNNSYFVYSVWLLIDTPQQAARVEQMLRARYPSWFPQADLTQTRPVRVVELHDYYFTPSSGFRSQGNMTTVYSLIAIAVLILLIAIINFVNFSTALIPRRIRNINTHKIFGCRNWVLRLNQIVEAMIIAFVSGVLALLLVHLISGTGFASLLAADIRIEDNLFLTGLTLDIALLSGLIAGLYPAFYSTSFPAAWVIKGSFGLSAQGRRLRTGLIALQYFISIALIIIALFVYRQYAFMRNHDIGIDYTDILSTQISPKMTLQRNAIAQTLKENPDVLDVTFSFVNVVGGGSYQWSFPYKDRMLHFTGLPVAPNFTKFMGIPVVEGRDFQESDQQKEGAYLFNQTAKYQTGVEVGNRLATPFGGTGEVVGIIRDFNFQSLYYSIEPLALFVCNEKSGWPLLQLYVKINGAKIEATKKFVEETLLAIDPNARNIVKLDFLDEQLGQHYAADKRLASLIFAFSLLAVMISTVGAFGLILFETQYRRKEIALRKTYGATIGNILYMFNRRYGIIVLICFVLAAPTAYLIIRHWQQNFAYQAPITVWIFILALVIVLLITLGTVTLQSYRSATENPSHSFKQE